MTSRSVTGVSESTASVAEFVLTERGINIEEAFDDVFDSLNRLESDQIKITQSDPVTTLSDHLNAETDRIQTLENMLENPDTDLFTLPNSTQTATSKFAQVDSNLISLYNDIGALQVDVGDILNVHLNAVSGEVDAVEASLATTNTTVTNNNSTLTNRIDSTDADLATTNSTVASINTTLTNRIDQTDANLTTTSNQLNTFVSDYDADQTVTGSKYFSDDVIRLANKYRLERNSTTGDLQIGHDDGIGGQVPFFTLKEAEAQSGTPHVQMDTELKLKDSTAMFLSSTGDTSLKEENSTMHLDCTSDGMRVRERTLDANENAQIQTMFEVSTDSNTSQYAAYIGGARLATEGYVTDEPVRILFKSVVIEGGVAGVTATRETVFKNPITIHAHPHTLNADFSLSADTSSDNAFTVQCPSEFQQDATFNNADIVDQNGDTKYEPAFDGSTLTAAGSYNYTTSTLLQIIQSLDDRLSALE